jgi:hypothetical protein
MSSGFTDFLGQLGRTIAFHPEMARMLGSIKAALLLQQLIYWTPKAADPDGWVYKTAEEWEEETSLSYKEQRLVRRILGAKRFGVIEERHDRLQHRLYFRVNKQALDDLWARKAVDQRAVREVTKGQFGNSPLGSSVLPGDDSQEKTTKITTTTGARAAKKPQPEPTVVSNKISKTSNKPTQDPLVAGFDRLWKVIPKRISTGTAKVEAWEAWKTLTPAPTRRHVTEMVRLLEAHLEEETDYAFYELDGSAKVTPARLIALLCRAMAEQRSLGDVLENVMLEDLDAETQQMST